MSQTSPPDELTPKHVRAARALLAWSQQELAKQAGVATSTVADFERSHRTPMANNALAIRTALEAAGISFLAQGAVIGPALPPFAPAARPGIPMRWIAAQDLADWASSNDGVAQMPTLLSHLIYATAGAGVWRRFPADESIRQSGWDGWTTGEACGQFVPGGEVGWEITSQREKIASKATSDYRKRTEEPAPFVPAESTYVFVSARPWPAKHKWVKERKAEGGWKDVRVYDADDLVHWIEQTPAVGLWLATRLNKRPTGVRELINVWEEWSLPTDHPLSEELVLSDRDQSSADIHRWLRAGPSMIALQGTTADEVVAFFHATLDMLPEDVSTAYRARCLIATTSDAARALSDAPAPLILLMTEPDPGLAKVLVARGHYVMQCYDDRLVSQGELRALERPSREGIVCALLRMGVAESKADSLARDCARNLTVLRRLMLDAPERRPRWASVSPSPALRAALLAGGWDESFKGDRDRVSELAELPYEKVATDLAPLVGYFDSPLQKVASTWRIKSPNDAWVLLAENLTSAELGRFENVALAVLGAEDPRFSLSPQERWLAPLRNIRPSHSELLRHGLGKTLILLALWGDTVKTAEAPKRTADHVVRRLLENADPARWWSLSGDFRLLAEASPLSFLEALEDSLERDDRPLSSLFVIEEGIGSGRSQLCGLLWALESLAWSPDWCSRVSRILAKLDSIDTTPTQYLNRPSNSLRNIFLLWAPQTYATLEQRLKNLDVLRRHENDAAWKLMLGILPTGSETLFPSLAPLWRDFTPAKVEEATWGLVNRGVVEVSQRLISEAGCDARRWTDLVERLPDLVAASVNILDALEQAEKSISDEEGRAAIWNVMRRTLHHHRQFPDAEWAMTGPELNQLEMIYERFAPKGNVQGIAWLFASGVSLPHPRPAPDWKEEQRDVEEFRRKAVGELLQAGGLIAVRELARQVEFPSGVSKALFDNGLSEPDTQALLEGTLLSGDSRELELAKGIIGANAHQKGQEWVEPLIAKARSSGWDHSAILAILLALPAIPWTWEQVHLAGIELEDMYWKALPVFRVRAQKDETICAIDKLISVHRARAATALAGREITRQLPTQLLVDLLDRAVLEPVEPSADQNESTMFQYYVGEIFKCLDERDDLDENKLALLEWRYLQLLEHSRRPPKVILEALAKYPGFFVQMLAAAFPPSEDAPEEVDQSEEINEHVVSQAFRLLRGWNRLPGMREDGSIDREALRSWIKDVISQAEQQYRKSRAYDQIGTTLSASPMGADGNWPAEAVRDVIDELRNKTLLEGFYRGTLNRRGGTTRLVTAGGVLERAEVEKYRGWSKALVDEHPYTARVLEMLANWYEAEARAQDDEAERQDWR